MLRNKSYLWFGLSVGVLVVVLQIFHYRVLIHDLDLELLEGMIAVTFLTLGILLSLSFKKIKSWLLDQKAAKKSGLSQREIDVLDLLAQGHTNQEIADKLFVSLNTIKTHISSIYGKLGVNRRTQAIQRAKELAILSSERVGKPKSP